LRSVLEYQNGGQFQAEMKRKRAGTSASKGKEGTGRGDELTLQRLSSEVAGNLHQISVEESELTIENIKKAFSRHFTSKITTGICDILAGEGEAGLM